MRELYEYRFGTDGQPVYVCAICAAVLNRSHDATKHTAWHEALRPTAQVTQ